MRGLKTAVAVMIVVALAVALVPSDGSEGSVTVTDDSTWYCYGDNPTFRFPDPTEDMEITWEVVDDTGADITPDDQRDESSIRVNLAGYDRVSITQYVSNGVDGDSMTIHVIPLHIPVGTYYTVTFHDGGFIDRQFIDNTTVIKAGDSHVILPMIERDGYELVGWFLEDGTTQFDATQPIEGDTHVYAKWKYTGVSGGSSDTELVGGIHTVTFNTTVGLECIPGEPGVNSIMFTVNVIGGYHLEGPVSVSSTSGSITQVADGQYLLTGIDRDIIVSVTGDVVQDFYDDNPGDVTFVTGNDNMLLVILLIIAALICVCLALYIMKTRGSRA